MAEENTDPIETTPLAEGEGADAAAKATEAHEIPAQTSPGAGDAVTPSEPPKSPSERRAARRAAAVAKRGPRRPAREQREEVRKAKAAQRRRYRAKVKEKRAAAPTPDAPEAQAPAPVAAGRAKTRQGVVVSDKADKTIVVRIDVARRHRRYNKILRSSSTLHVHDERNDANEGDTVRVMESRPMSRTKRWRLIEVVERAR
jgi:small subunit ribosomal protein S17